MQHWTPLRLQVPGFLPLIMHSSTLLRRVCAALPALQKWAGHTLLSLKKKTRCLRARAAYVLSSSFSHKELVSNRESRNSYFTPSHFLLTRFTLWLSLSLQLPHLTSLFSLLTPLAVSISLVLTEATTTSLSLLPSSLPRFRLSFLTPQHIIVETERLCGSRRRGGRSGRLVSVLWAFQSVSFCLFFLSLFLLAASEIVLLFCQLETDVWSSSPFSLLTYTSIIVCLPRLPAVSPSRHPLSIKRMTVLSLPLGSSVLFNYFLTVFIASSWVVLSCSRHLWPHSPLTVSAHYLYSLCFILVENWERNCEIIQQQFSYCTNLLFFKKTKYSDSSFSTGMFLLVSIVFYDSKLNIMGF